MRGLAIAAELPQNLCNRIPVVLPGESFFGSTLPRRPKR